MLRRSFGSRKTITAKVCRDRSVFVWERRSIRFGLLRSIEEVRLAACLGCNVTGSEASDGLGPINMQDTPEMREFLSSAPLFGGVGWIWRVPLRRGDLVIRYTAKWPDAEQGGIAQIGTGGRLRMRIAFPVQYVVMNETICYGCRTDLSTGRADPFPLKPAGPGVYRFEEENSDPATEYSVGWHIRFG